MTNNGATLTNANTVYVTITPSIFEVFVSSSSNQGTGALMASLNFNLLLMGLITLMLTLPTPLSIADQTTNTKTFVITHNKSAYYRIAFIGRNTQSSTVYGYFWVVV